MINVSHVPDTPENVERCICPECPSFPGVGILYCARGQSEQPVRERGCICPECQNFKEFDLQDEYYCVEGRAK